MFFESRRRRPLSVRSAWAQAMHIGETLYLAGWVCVLVHLLVEILMVVGAVGKLYPVPSWVWIELDILVYVLAPVVWFRLLCVVCTHALRWAQKERYLYVALASGGAFVAALQPSTSWWTFVAFPLLSVTYIVHFGLDAHLPVRRRRKLQTDARFWAATGRRMHPGCSSAEWSSQHLDRALHWQFDSAPAAGVVSVWYCLDDRQWAREFCKHLLPDVRRGLFTLRHCVAGPGTRRSRKNAQVIKASAVAVVFVSAQMMASEAFTRYDVQEIAQQSVRGTPVLIVYISACALHGSGLQELQAVNSLEKPLAKLRRADRATVFYQTASFIRDHLCQ